MFYNLKEVVDVLLKHQAEVNVASKGRSPITPLQMACARGNVQIVSSLIQADAKVDALYETQGEKFNSLMLTLHSAEITAAPVREAICELLVGKGVNSTTPRSDGCTPMMCGIDQNMTDFVKLILEKNLLRLDTLAVCIRMNFYAFQDIGGY